MGVSSTGRRPPRGRLALVIVCDQLSRNMHRRSAAAFANDALAVKHCLAALAAGEDSALAPFERTFLLMPLEHAEDSALQARSVAEFTRLRDSVAPDARAPFDEFHRHAVQHAAIIERFGRFPHRNASLGRTPTEAEIAWLADGGPDFDQAG